MNINNAENGRSGMLVSASSLSFLMMVITEEREAEAADCVCCCLTSSSLNASSGLARGSERAFLQANTELVKAALS